METVWIVLTHLIFIQLVKGSVTNVARNKPASMSSSYQGATIAARAVDGDTNAVFPDRGIHTALGRQFAWWKVDLEKDVQDATVKIYLRTDYKARRNGIQIYTSTTPFSSYPAGQLCYTVTGDPSGSDIDDVVSVTCPGRWRYLLVYTNTDNNGDGPVLDFGEVMVLACSDGTYGEKCTKTCNSRRCVTMTTTCDRDGRCPGGCQTGWTGVDCTQVCVSNFYGSACSFLCSNRKCLNSAPSCDHVTGLCEGGCQPGYTGTDCVQNCDFNFYGPGCRFLCSNRKCLNSASSCDHVTGLCVGGCQSGYNGMECVQHCDSNFYGSGCSLPCSNRKCLNSGSSCNHVTGLCVGGCQLGYTGTDCVQICQTGMYGVNCMKSCSSRHCVTPSSECDHQTGQCIGGCQEGWRGVDCVQACPSGSFGAACNKMCGHCINICNHVTGNCPGDCQHGWEGRQCQQVSQSGIPMTTVVGAVVGTFLVVVLVGFGIHLCLIRQGRLKWVKVTNKSKSKENAGDNTQMRNLGQEHVRDTEIAHSSYAYNNDYAELNAETQPGNKDYDVIQQKHYRNT